MSLFQGIKKTFCKEDIEDIQEDNKQCRRDEEPGIKMCAKYLGLSTKDLAPGQTIEEFAEATPCKECGHYKSSTS